MDYTPASSASEPTVTPQLAQQIASEVAKAVVGQNDVLELMLTTYFAHGHMLFEGVPGLAKTLLVKALALAVGGNFSRIQFTPDLLPSDILGTSVFDLSSREFNFRAGPVFGSFVLADEINRTPPKTQAALLEAMEERQVTVDGVQHQLPTDFTVFATQNPVEYEGTYPLPEAQLDRFLIKCRIDYPALEEEKQVLKRYHTGFNPHNLDSAGIKRVIVPEHWPKIKAEIDNVCVEDGVLGYILSLVRATRSHRGVALGASPRAGIALLLGSKALAAVRGKRYITPDEVQTLAGPVLRHRLLLTPESEIEGAEVDSVIMQVLSGLPVPR